MEYSKDAASFLDILIKHNIDKIWWDIYYRSTDIHRCFSFSSDHPNHCKKSISFTVVHHICSIVEKTELKNETFRKS